jgi:hypothetical protein
MSTIKFDLKRYSQNPSLRTKKSDSGVQLVFVPGEDYINELNEVASDVLHIFDSAKTITEVKTELLSIYDVTEFEEFDIELRQIIQSFLQQKILMEL